MPKTYKIAFTLEINENEPVDAMDVLEEIRDSACGYDLKDITINGKDLDTILDEQIESEPEGGVDAD